MSFTQYFKILNKILMISKICMQFLFCEARSHDKMDTKKRLRNGTDGKKVPPLKVMQIRMQSTFIFMSYFDSLNLNIYFFT